MTHPTVSRFAPAGAFIFLLLLSLSAPHLLQAIFPGGRGSPATAPLPPEERTISASPVEPAVVQQIRLQENLAWISGEDNAGLISPDEISLADGEILARDGLDLSPGILVEYSRYWDSLEITREITGVGGFLFISTRTHFQALARHLRFEDEFDEIEANGGSLEAAHLFPNELILAGGLHGLQYKDLHSSWNGYLEAGKRVSSKIYLDMQASWRDIWERIINIRDKLRLFDLAAAVTYQFLQFWSAHVLGSWGSFSDDNERLFGVSEITRQLPMLRGLSLGLGVEATTFLSQKPTYWSPSYYHLIFARLRWTNRPLPWPFPFSVAEDDDTPRLTALLEYVPGVNDQGRFEQSARAGLRYRITRKISADAEFSTFSSEDRFGDNYNEKRVDGKLVVQFP